MKISAVKIRKLFSDNEDLYEKIVVASKRHRQIVESRVVQLEAFEEIEDTDQLEQYDDIDHNVEKPISIAMGQLFDNELEWSYEKEE